MYRIKLSLLFFLLVILSMYSQNKVIDSLEHQLLNYKKNDTVKVNLLNELTHKLYSIDLKKADSIISLTEKVLNTLDYKLGYARLLYYKGRIISKKYNYKASITYFNEALIIFKELYKKTNVADCYSGIARNNFSY